MGIRWARISSGGCKSTREHLWEGTKSQNDAMQIGARDEEELLDNKRRKRENLVCSNVNPILGYANEEHAEGDSKVESYTNHFLSAGPGSQARRG